MVDMIINSTNLLIAAIVAVICYTFWRPYIHGKKVEGVVDSFCHPIDDADGKESLAWCYKFVYRETKGGKRLYCYSRRKVDTREELKKYPKGSTVNLKVFDPQKNYMQAVILDDKEDMKQSMIYTVLIIIGGVAMAIGYQFLSHMSI